MGTEGILGKIEEINVMKSCPPKRLFVKGNDNLDLRGAQDFSGKLTYSHFAENIYSSK